MYSAHKNVAEKTKVIKNNPLNEDIITGLLTALPKNKGKLTRLVLVRLVPIHEERVEQNIQ